MKYRRFGRTELSMSVFSCGGMRFQQSWNARDGARVSAENQRRLEATIERALELGITHIETARGYGTSEEQLGRFLPSLERDQYILQTKVGPSGDPRRFQRNVEDSLKRLRADYVDLFAFHGLNEPQALDQVLRPGCLEVAERLREQGRIRSIGFSTHAPAAFIETAIESGRFDYVNLHYYYIFQDNLPALDAAAKADMGVFIISPSDKGGLLYRPSEKLARLCEPFSPMVFNDLFCLSHPQIQTISIGASRPSDFDEHMKALSHLDAAAEAIRPVVERLEAEFRRVLGDSWASSWSEGLPSWCDVPDGVNVRTILWLGNLARAFDMVEYARMRYRLLRDGGGHWFPGRAVRPGRTAALAACLERSPHAAEIPGRLEEIHAELWEPPTLRERWKARKQVVLGFAKSVVKRALGRV